MGDSRQGQEFLGLLTLSNPYRTDYLQNEPLLEMAA